MCNKVIAFSKETGTYVIHQQMDTPSSVGNFVDETPRVKLLCSFLGSIMPRPQDGKLRYVGGETRFVSIPKDVGYQELMSKMRELYESASILKYQQPDEDLDALVSVVNDDDVVNMMEEYEKLGSGDGFTRLRIFLFPHSDSDGSLHYIDGDERGTERRYVDALNYLNDGTEFRRLHMDSTVVSPGEDHHLQDAFYDGLMHGNRSSDISVSQYNLRHVAVPQRYSDSDGPWSPAYYSPRHYGGHIDPRTVSEFPNSPPSGRYRMQFGECFEKIGDRISEDMSRSQIPHHPVYEHPTFGENISWMHTGAGLGEKSGFPGNLFHTGGGFDGSSSCEHCKASFPRNQFHLEQSNIINGHPHAPKHASHCSNREPLVLNTDQKTSYAIYSKEQNDPNNFFNETHGHDRGWNLQHQPLPSSDESCTPVYGPSRCNNQGIADCHPLSYPVGRVNIVDNHYIASNLTHQRAAGEMRHETFHDHSMPFSHNVYIPSPEDRSGWYGNHAFIPGAGSLEQMAPGNSNLQTHLKNGQNPVHGASPYGTSLHMNGSVEAPYLVAGSDIGQRIGAATENYHQWGESSHAPVMDYYKGPSSLMNKGTQESESKRTITLPPVHPSMPTSLPVSSPIPENSSHLISESKLNPTGELNKVNNSVEKEEMSFNVVDSTMNHNAVSLSSFEDSKTSQVDGFSTGFEPLNADHVKLPEETNIIQTETKLDSLSILEDPKLSRLSFVPELGISVNKVALEEAGDQTVSGEKAADDESAGLVEIPAGSEDLNADEYLQLDDTGHKIESTKAEAEAIKKGLQTIRNEDLEEIRELGSGTYGAVYHGKWKGSDVAIKRIKASCFVGRPSERERLIADFWKEALTLSSLHHPNVVSFYGIVRDGVEGSLATVTEFMINGSLKQFLHKKDRTIDRRKRLIIAMDAAFGMEYLHGKNIVHFDLKCENLLVNMRDPQRPICKIGDLGLSKVKQHTLVSGGVRGTLPWMAPELLNGKSHLVTDKIDVYSFGIVMWEILTGEEPYAGMHGASIIGGIVNNTLRPEIPSWCDPEWKALMQMCWSPDPADRPSFTDISRKLRTMAAAINLK